MTPAQLAEDCPDLNFVAIGGQFKLLPKFKEELTAIGIQYVIPGCEKMTDDKTPAQLTLF